MKIPYQLVSMAAMLRDFFALNSDDYLNKEHQMLTDIADYLYNSADGAFSDHPEDNLLPEFKVIFDNYGADYFKQVTDDMYAIDSQVTSTAKEDELYDDYQDRLAALKGGIGASTKVTASYSEDYYDFDDFVMDLGDRLAEQKISRADADREIKKFCRDHRTCDYRTLHNIVYENAAGKVDAENDRLRSKIKDMRNKSVKASDNPFYDKLSESSKRFVRNTEKKMATMFSPYTFDVYNALLPYIGEYESNTGWTGSCDLMKVEDDTTVDGYTYNIVWDDGHDVDMFSWRINDNPRIDGDYTLMILPAHGMPEFCDSENDFYRAIRKVFGNGLKKLG